MGGVFKYFFLFLFLAGAGLCADPPKTLALAEAIEMALQNNLELARLSQRVRESELGISAAESDFSITITPMASIVSQDGEGSWRYGVRAGKKLEYGTILNLEGAVARRDDEDTSDSYGSKEGVVRLELRQPLFRNFGRLVNIERKTQARSDMDRAVRNYFQGRARLALNVTEAFEVVNRLKRQIELDQGSADRMDKLYRLTQAKEKQGKTTRIDTLRVDLQRGQALLRLTNNVERLTVAQQGLAELLGCPMDSKFNLEEVPLLDHIEESMENILGAAYENRLDYAQALHDLNDLDRGVALARKRLWPDVSLISSYSRRGKGGSFSDAFGFDDDSWFAGLVLESDLNSASERVELARKVSGRETGGLTIDILELAIAREVQEAMSDCRKSEAEGRIAERNKDLAGSRLKLSRRMFEIGRADNFSVTDAEQAYIDAENSLLMARSEASLSVYRLKYVLGTLVESPDWLKPTFVK